MPYRWGEVLLVEFPQSGIRQPKKRPALVILDIDDADIILAPVTTRERAGTGDVSITDWQAAGLLRPSWVRLAKIACLDKTLIARQGAIRSGHHMMVYRLESSARTYAWTYDNDPFVVPFA